ncbi:MAG: putative bifunctional diguanylate cyclase/phosphodiesterase [Anaerovoracaceae bacterium]|jgi:diguanylate cyclase (GGDEF)-like protein
MTREKLKKVDIKSFLIPFAILFLVFALVTSFNIKSHIDKTYDSIEEYSLSLVDSYIRRIHNSRAATEIIAVMVDEKLLLIGEILLQASDGVDSGGLNQVAEKYSVDEINLYNQRGIIIKSTEANHIGWKAYESHPVQHLLASDQTTSTEEIRVNSVSGMLTKYAYVKSKDGSIVQIGISSERIDKFLQAFSVEKLIEDFIENRFIENIFFTDTDYNLIASGTAEYAGVSFDDEDIHNHFMSDTPKIGKGFMNNGLLHVCAPVFYDGEKLGTLTVVWSSKIITTDINRLIVENVLRFFIISLILSGVLFYAYRKRKFSVKMAFYDGLTGLPNDNYLKWFLPSKIKDCNHGKTAIMLLNLSNFNLINHTHGYEYGDKVLQQTVKIYSDHIPPKGKLFRLDADKFVMVVEQYGEITELENLSKQILKDYRSPEKNTLKHEYLNLKISIYELYDPDFSVGRVLHDASLAISTLKKEESKDFIVFTHDMRDALIREEAIEKALLSVIEGKCKDCIQLHYQPLFCAKTSDIIGFEALARLTVHNIGQIQPAEFIDIAERRNLIFPLGGVILNKAFNFLERLHAEGYTNTFIAVNISGLQLLREGFIDTVKSLTDTSPKYYGNLVFEITESALIENLEIAKMNLKLLRELGISIALDDFGTGYSSLSELRNMDVDILKIDHTFIDKISQNGPLITQDIITMAHRLGLRTVAEEVETEPQMDYLIEHGCDIIQGFHISKPLPEKDAIDFLKQRTQKV